MHAASSSTPSISTDSTSSSSSSSEQTGVDHRGKSVSSFIQLNRAVSKFLDKALEISAYAFVVFSALGAALYDWGLNADISFKYAYYAIWPTVCLLVVKIVHEAFLYFRTR